MILFIERNFYQGREDEEEIRTKSKLRKPFPLSEMQIASLLIRRTQNSSSAGRQGFHYLCSTI